VQDFRRYFLRGLVVVLPPIVTVWMLYELGFFLYENVGKRANMGVRYVAAFVIAESHTSPPAADGDDWTQLNAAGPWVPTRVYNTVRQHLPPGQRVPNRVHDLYEQYIYYEYYEPRWYLSFSGLLVAAVVIYFIGHVLATFIGRSIWHVAEQTVSRLPVVRAVYPHVKQFIDFLLSEQKREYSRVVAVEYPRRGIWSIGLVTGDAIRELEQATGQEMLTIFVPYSPWSMTGYAITAARTEVIDMNITVDQAIRFVVSGGVIRPRAATSEPAPVAGVGAVALGDKTSIQPAGGEPPP
jgi:uncharacterized membrane protein